MGKIAKLIGVSLMVRVIVEDNLSEEEELDAIATNVRKKCVDQILNDGIGDHIESIEEDEECPFGSIDTDK